jgi:hypothetical protein
MAGKRFLGTSPRPRCAAHPDARVWKNGLYGRPGHRRPRYRCFPADGSRSHVFTEQLPRRQIAGEECIHCERPVAPHEGPATARRHRFAVREIAEALIVVGKGTTYRAAAAQARRSAGYPTSRDGRLIRDWIEVFVPPLYLAEREQEWPPFVIIDALPFHVSDRSTRRLGGLPAFTIFAAMGQEKAGFGVTDAEAGRRLLALRAHPGVAIGQQLPDWLDFLAGLKEQLAGVPRQFVVDMDPFLMRALRTIWPNAEHAVPGTPPAGPVVWWCHWHVRQAIDHQLERAGFVRGSPLRVELERALDNRANWQAFTQDVASLHAKVYRKLRNYLARLEPKLSWQIEHRHTYLATSGALESFLRDLRHSLGDRRGTFTNRERTNRMLELVLLEANGKASIACYSKLIRDELTLNGGFAMPRRQILDAAGNPSLRAANP